MKRLCKTRTSGAALNLLVAGLLVACSDDDPKARCSVKSLQLCQLSPGYGNPYEGQLDLMSWTQLLRKVGLELNGRLPSAAERSATDVHGQLGFEASLWDMMYEEAFLDRIKEIYNDSFLTDKYLGGENAVSLLDVKDYPNLKWYEGAKDKDRLRERTNDGIAREVLELIAYVIRNDRSFKEILTADYTVANGYSASAFIGYKGMRFRVPDEPERYRPIRVPGRPHAGILSSPMFLNRFPTSDTNRNRHRARMVYQFFLGSDINALGDRPIDANATDVQNPTRYDPACVTCHSVMDPVAGAFQAFNEKGAFDAKPKWYDDMRPPGFGGEPLPEKDFHRGLQWLARRLVENPGFAQATVYALFRGLTGQAPLSPVKPVVPGSPTAEELALDRAFQVQQNILGTVQARFVESGYNFKFLIREIVLTPYFRAAGALRPMLPDEEQEMSSFGTARLLTPEQLNRKIRAVSGARWGDDGDDYLLEEYRLFYGGIDSDLVTQRIEEPNGVMAAIAQRMAHEVACRAVSADFARDSGARVLFPGIDAGTQPSAPNELRGEVLSAAQYLHAQLLGEELAADDPEILATATLFNKVWAIGQEGLQANRFPKELPEPCRANRDPLTGKDLGERRVVEDPYYTLRAWMAVVSYLLSDYRFLHE